MNATIEINPRIAILLAGCFYSISSLEYITAEEDIMLFNNLNLMRQFIDESEMHALDQMIKTIRNNKGEFNKIIEESSEKLGELRPPIV